MTTHNDLFDLSDLPINQAVEVAGVVVCLQIHSGGAVLRAELGIQFATETTARYLKLGFSNAIEFDAGLALDPASQRLVLTRWLQGVSNWSQAAAALESLLNQVDVSSAAGKGAARQIIREPARLRAEQRLRAQFSY